MFPRWLLREFELGEELVAPTHVSEDLDRVLSRRQHRLAALVEGRVCATCNNGWMSALEAAAKPTLSALIRGERILDSLSYEERRLLARWTAKTAYNLSWSANYPRKAPLIHLRDLRIGPALPDQVVVIAGRYDGDSPFYWLQSPTWSVELGRTTPEEAAAIASRSYKIGFQFAQLVLLVAYWPAPGWLYRIHPPMHRTLWPTFNLWALDIGQLDITFEHPYDAVIAFHMLLGIVEPGAIEGKPILIKPPW